mgnify:FL=1
MAELYLTVYAPESRERATVLMVHYSQAWPNEQAYDPVIPLDLEW